MISPDGGVHVQVSYLEVSGARLRCEISGAGPVLLLIPGAAADAAAFAGITPRLRDRFTVVAYDPRGTCRSSQLGPPIDITVQMQADDAHRLLIEAGLGPATVFGSSAGGGHRPGVGRPPPRAGTLSRRARAARHTATA